MKYFFLKCGVLLILFPAFHIELMQAQNNKPVVFNNLKIEQSEDYLTGNIYQKDVLLFFDMLESTHPAFAPNTQHPFNIKDTCKEGYEWAKSCTSINDLWVYLQNVASSLNDSHTMLYADYNSSLIYPFMYYKVGGSFYLYTITRQHSSSLGKKIVGINGYPINKVVESFKPLFSYDNEIDFEQKIKNQISFEVLWASNPYKSTDSLLHLAFDDGTTIDLEPKTANNRDLVALRTRQNLASAVRQNSNDLFLYKIFENQGICYLQFNLCEDQSSLRVSLLNNNQGLTPERIEQTLALYPRFDTFLNGMFEEISSKNIKTLVIDVRNNKGGNSNLCEVLLSWLMPLEKQVSLNTKIRLSALWEMSYPQFATEYKEAFTKNGVPYQLGEIYDGKVLSNILVSKDGKYKMFGINYDELFVKNTDSGKVFNGNVIFIQNEDTYSSAGILITKAVDNGIGMVMGNESAFKPCHYGDLLIWQLPNTAIKGTTSHKLFLRPNSARCNEKSIRPAIHVSYTWNDVLDGNDVYWSWIVNMFAKKQ